MVGSLKKLHARIYAPETMRDTKIRIFKQNELERYEYDFIDIFITTSRQG